MIYTLITTDMTGEETSNEFPDFASVMKRFRAAVRDSNTDTAEVVKADENRVQRIASYVSRDG